MKNLRIGKLLVLQLLTVILLMTGCQVSSSMEKKERAPSATAKKEKFTHLSGSAIRAIYATGGEKRWSRTNQILYESVVTIYKPSGSYYLTEQHNTIKPWQNSIVVKGSEPEGEYIWNYTHDEFSRVEGGIKAKHLGMRISESILCEAVLTLVTAPLRMLDEGVILTEVSEPVKKEGLSYHAIERFIVQPSEGKPEQGADDEPKWPKVVFYQNQESSLIDFIWYADSRTDTYVAVRGYNYLPISEGAEGVSDTDGILVPRKIEIYRTDSQGVIIESLVALDISNPTH